jgi:hypothetical protein
MSAPDLSALSAPNVRIAITGAVWKAPLGSTLPTDGDPFAALDSAFTNLGYISEDGVTEALDDSVDDVVAWQSATTVRSSTTQSTINLNFTMIETKGSVLSAFYRGSTISASGAGIWKMEVKPITADPSIWVLDALDGTIYERSVIGNGEIVERGEVQNMNGGAKAYPVVVRCYPDANGNSMVKYSNDPTWGYS